MSLVGRFGLAHACPVEALDGSHPHIVTAAHVASYLPRGASNVQQIPLAYAFQQGETVGTVIASPSHPPMWAVDLAWLDIVSGNPITYNTVAQGVRVGEEVEWFEYDYSSDEKMLQAIHRKSKVVRVVAGHLVTKETPQPGASGGCLFNEYGEVVGIVSFGLQVTSLAGVGGDWAGVGVVYTRELFW